MAQAASSRVGATPPWTRLQELILPVGIICSVLVILVPLPSQLMDLLLAANIAVAVIILLTTVYVRTPLEFSIFPSLLLATTLMRLVLNVATTRRSTAKVCCLCSQWPASVAMANMPRTTPRSAQS